MHGTVYLVGVLVLLVIELVIKDPRLDLSILYPAHV